MIEYLNAQRLARPIVAISLAGLAMAIIIDVALTYSGILFLGIAIELPIVGQSGLAFAYAFVLAAALLAAELTLASRSGSARARYWWLFAATLSILLVVQSVGAVLHFVQLENLSEGANLEDTQKAALAGLTSRSLAADKSIELAYRRAIDSQQNLGDLSAHGMDETREHVCGSLCKGAYRTARVVQGQYAMLAEPLAPQAASDAAGQYAALQSLFGQLKAKSAAYMAMCGRLHWQCSDPAAAIEASPGYQRISQEFSGARLPDRQTLVLNRAAESGLSLFDGTPTLRSILLVIFVLALPGAELALVFLLRSALASPMRTYEAELEETKRQSTLLDELLHAEAERDAKEALRRANDGRFRPEPAMS